MAQSVLLSVFIERPWAWLAIVLAFTASWTVPGIMKFIVLRKIPTAGEDMMTTEERRKAYLSGARKVYTDGYQTFKNKVFRITTSRKSPVIVISPEFLPELKKIPDSILSMSAAVNETMEARYTQIDTHVPIIPHTIKSTLTPSLSRLNPVLHRETRDALSLEFPSGSEWQEVDIHHVLLRVVAIVSGRIFVGPELCRSEKYLDAAINYTLDVMGAQRAVQQIRPWLRPLIAPSLPEVKRLDQRLKEAENLLKPVVDLRKEAAKDPSVIVPDDMLQWLLQAQDKFQDPASQNLAKSQLGLSFAAIHTTALTATNAFYDLIALPGFALELREEVAQALRDNGGILTASALQSMKKMDSFLKEVLRLSPASMASFQRKVLSPFTLSDGQKIPSGVTIEVPAVAVNADSENYPDAATFDPLRFYNMRKQAGDRGSVEAAAQGQFVSVTQTSLTFGYGRHACPGRFFAANEIKMILSAALLDYEFKMPDGQVTRYPNVEFAHMCIPDVSKKIFCRRLPRSAEGSTSF